MQDSIQFRGAKVWDRLFSKCLEERTEFSEFETLVEDASRHAPVSGKNCMEAFMRQKRPIILDPRLVTYVELLLRSGEVDIHDVLGCVLQVFMKSSVNEAATTSATERGRDSYEACILQGLTRQLSVNDSISADVSGRIRAIYTLKPFAAWLAFFHRTFSDEASLSSPQLEVADAFGQFAVSYVNRLSLIGILDKGAPKEFQKIFGRYLPSFVTLISQTNVELAQNLDLLQKQTGLYEGSITGPPNSGLLDEAGLNTLTYHESVLDTPPVTTRATTYIYLNAMLTGQPLSDDAAMFDYLTTRYDGDVPALVTDFVIASFDVLANAIDRTESSDLITFIRSFLTNKLPTILNYYSSMIFPPLTAEFCISQALNRMDPAAYLPYTQMVDLLGSAGMLADARSEFLFACALHQLIPEQSIEGMLGDVPMQSMSEAGKYTKEELIIQCTAHSGKVEELIGELENMEGNAGEIVRAVIEIIQSLCAAKDSFTLKGICNTLSRKTQTLDIIMLFIRPSALLQPLCQLIDQWQDHEDQGENHPVYDEFGSIFLLILIINHHFSLQDHDLGIDHAESFVLKYLRSGQISRDPSMLTEHESQQLGNWIRGLYETEGLNDELMSTCSPKDFHLLVATLFDQSLKACQAGKLGLDTLKGGFEYLLEPFLLPSLITGLGWFAKRLWETDKLSQELDILIPALQALVKPASISGDSAALHEAVLSVVGEPLTLSLAHIQNLHPRRADIEPLAAILKTNTQPCRNDASSHNDLEAWCSTPGGGILIAVCNTVHALTQWCSTDSLNAILPNYSHRQLLAAIQILGAKSVLHALIDETLKQMASGPPDIILDIVTALITAPNAADSRATNSVVPWKRQLSLRDALGIAFNDAYELSKSDEPRAGIIVRLHRRVEAQLARSNQQMNIVTEVSGDEMLLDLNNAVGDGQGAMGEQAGQGMQDTDLDHVVAGVMDEILAAEGSGDASFMEM